MYCRGLDFLDELCQAGSSCFPKVFHHLNVLRVCVPVSRQLKYNITLACKKDQWLASDISPITRLCSEIQILPIT